MKRLLKVAGVVVGILYLPSACRLIEAAIAVKNSSSVSPAAAAVAVEGAVQDWEREMWTAFIDSRQNTEIAGWLDGDS